MAKSVVLLCLLGSALHVPCRALVPGPWSDRGQPARLRAGLLLEQLTVEEKIEMLHGPASCVDFASCFSTSSAYVGVVAGNSRLGIPPLHMHDGPQGFRCLHAPGTSTAWPAMITVAATWDPALARDYGAAMGREFRGKGANVQLGPGMEVVRVPQSGRNFESLSGEDPYLGAALVGPVVRGIQSNSVIANAKHWILNHQETNRGHAAYVYNGTNSAGVASDADERTRMELYYRPFEAAVRAGVGSVMCSYNRVGSFGERGGAWSCEDRKSLREGLKEGTDFRGFVVSDWGATHSASIAEGLDVEMPGAFWMNAARIKAGMSSKSITEEMVDDSVRRILTAMFAVGVMDEPPSTWDSNRTTAAVSTAEHRALARRLSSASTVLLKNEGDLLPLPTTARPSTRRLVLLGFAGENAVIGGGGSGSVVPSALSTPLDAFRAAAGNGAVVDFNNGTDVAAAAELAAAADYAVVFVGTISHEGADRASLSLDDGCEVAQAVDTGSAGSKSQQCMGNAHEQNRLVSAVAATGTPTIVVASVPGPVVMPWAGQVAAIVTNFLPGQEVGNAIADVIFGKVSPAGKLPVTFPNRDNEQNFSQAQYPGLPNRSEPAYVQYTEKLLTGYRYYDSHRLGFSTGFPFGHGLSYTVFRYGDLRLSCEGPWSCSATFNVANSGRRAGQEVAQLYLGFPPSAGEPPRLLRGFHKTPLLQPGEGVEVTLALSERDFSVWDVPSKAWRPVAGTFTVEIGSSSRDFRLNAPLSLPHQLEVGAMVRDIWA